MAKTKAVVKACATPAGYSPSIYLDVIALDSLKDLKVGEEVTVVLKGKLRSIEQREGYDDPKKLQGNLSLKDYEISITAGSDVWDELSEEEDD